MHATLDFGETSDEAFALLPRVLGSAEIQTCAGKVHVCAVCVSASFCVNPLELTIGFTNRMHANLGFLSLFPGRT